MAIQVRRGNEVDFDPSKMLPGEWAVSLDTKYVRMCFSPGICLRMATYEAFEADMAQIQAILEEAKTVEEAIQKIYDDVQQVVIDIETASSAAQTAIEKSEESKEFATAAASSASAAKTSETNAKSSASSASTSASTATKKATEASTYANNAKNSENTANTHATTASTKASEASTSANTASVKANDASDSALLAESYTHGGTGVRNNEDVDNAQYYKNQAERISQGLSGALLPMGTITFSQLANQTKQAGYMYNISNSFTTDNTFKEGAGYSYPEGTNVYYTADGYWDCIAGTSVVGVKGYAESSYRKGNVNITKSNIGLSNVDNTSDADKPISDATQAALGEVNERIDESVLDLQAQIDATNSDLTAINESLATKSNKGFFDDIGQLPHIKTKDSAYVVNLDNTEMAPIVAKDFVITNGLTLLGLNSNLESKVIVNGVKTNLKVYTKFISQTISVKAGNSIQFSVNISGYGLSMLTYVTVSIGQRGIRIEPNVNSSNASELVFTVLNIADTDYDGVIYPYILIIGY